MNYLLKSSRREAGNGKRLIFAFVFTCLVLAVHAISPTFFGNIFGAIAYPFWKMETGAGDQLGAIGTGLTSKESIAAENARLKEEIKLFETERLQFAALKEENRQLKEIMGRVGEKNIVTLARVLKRPAFSPYDVLIIDGGSDADMVVGDQVFVLGDILLGYVSETTAKSANVKLYSSPGEKLEVKVGTKGIQATALGKGGGNFEISMPREVEVKEGDQIYFASLDQKIFAVAEKVEFDPAEAFHMIYFKAPVNISELEWVQVTRSF